MHQKKSGFRRSQYCFVIVRTMLIKQLKWLAGKIGKRLPLLERKVESSSPIKIHKYQLKKNERSEKNYLILNKNSKIIKPDDSKRDFDYAPLKTEPTQAIDTTTEKNHYGDAYTLVNITGHLTFNGSEETLQVKGKTLTKQEAVFTDNTGSIWVLVRKTHPKGDLWHLLQHKNHCCQGMWRQVSDTHKAQQNCIYSNDKAFHQQQHTRMDSTTILLKNKTLVLPRYGNFSVFIPSSQLRCFPAISINML